MANNITDRAVKRTSFQRRTIQLAYCTQKMHFAMMSLHFISSSSTQEVISSNTRQRGLHPLSLCRPRSRLSRRATGAPREEFEQRNTTRAFL